MVSFSAQCRLIMFSLCYTNWHINNLFVLLFLALPDEGEFTEMSWLTMATSVGNSKYSVRYTCRGSTKRAHTHKDVQLDTHTRTHTHVQREGHTDTQRAQDTEKIFTHDRECLWGSILYCVLMQAFRIWNGITHVLAARNRRRNSSLSCSVCVCVCVCVALRIRTASLKVCSTLFAFNLGNENESTRGRGRGGVTVRLCLIVIEIEC